MTPPIVSKKHPANVAESYTLLPTWPCCENLPTAPPWQLGQPRVSLWRVASSED